jgi:hypothetical protein
MSFGYDDKASNFMNDQQLEPDPILNESMSSSSKKKKKKMKSQKKQRHKQ